MLVDGWLYARLSSLGRVVKLLQEETRWILDVFPLSFPRSFQSNHSLVQARCRGRLCLKQHGPDEMPRVV